MGQESDSGCKEIRREEGPQNRYKEARPKGKRPEKVPEVPDLPVVDSDYLNVVMRVGRPPGRGARFRRAR